MIIRVALSYRVNFKISNFLMAFIGMVPLHEKTLNPKLEVDRIIFGTASLTLKIYHIEEHLYGFSKRAQLLSSTLGYRSPVKMTY